MNTNRASSSKWYSNDRPAWIVGRSLIVLAVGCVVVWIYGGGPSLWLAAIGVPVLLAAISLVQWRSKQRTAPQSREFEGEP